VAFCPTKVLAMKGGKAVVVNLEACTNCLFCELRCPDFAIAVFSAED
jgi:2-oxoglutarate ferredoxin oxidoreductase subunit delta